MMPALAKSLNSATEPGEAFRVPLDGDTAVIACHFNPCGYERPRRNLQAFLGFMGGCRAPIFMAELTFGSGPREIAAGDRVLHLHLDGPDGIFHKEGMLNAVERIVPAQFTKLLWVDADVILTNPDWLAAASSALDEAAVVQLFERAILTDDAWSEVAVLASTAHAHTCDPERAHRFQYHAGLAWGARREMWSEAGGLYAHSVAGHGDTVFALAAIDRFHRSHPHAAAMSAEARIHAERYARRLTEWRRCRPVTAVAGDAIHLWHGSVERRGYAGKARLLSAYDPLTHVRKTASGLLEWTAAAPEPLTSALKSTFPARREDDPT